MRASELPPAFLDELGDGVHGLQDTLGRLLVADRHAKGPLDGEHELERVDRVQPESLAEQRHVVGDLRWRETAAADSARGLP